MTALTENPQPAAPDGPRRIVVSVDAMGGDRGPATVVAGLARSAGNNPDIAFLLHGDEAVLKPLVTKHAALAGRCEIRHADEVVTMEDKPAQVLRHGQKTSMYSTIEAVRDGDAGVAVSCGNTGALMVLSMMRLRKLPGVNRPAIACYWPSTNPAGFNVMLDVGADVRADAADLLQYALMGVSYARNSLNITQPRVGLLNVGTEDHKGRTEIKAAAELIADAAGVADFEFIGNVEGSDIPSNRVDVIVTDGFTGNVALKTAEGTAGLIKSVFQEALTATLPAKIGALFAARQLKILSRRTDPRQVNGGVFLGLNGTVVKSHGAADATGIAAAVTLAYDLARHDFNHKLAARVASVVAPGQDGQTPQQAGDSQNEEKK
jgi:phosphate acyltransferase